MSFSGCRNTPKARSIGISSRSRFMSVDFTVFVDDKDFKMLWLFDENFIKLNPPLDNNFLTFVDIYCFLFVWERVKVVIHIKSCHYSINNSFSVIIHSVHALRFRVQLAQHGESIFPNGWTFMKKSEIGKNGFSCQRNRKAYWSFEQM